MSVADPAQLEELRRLERPAAEDDLVGDSLRAHGYRVSAGSTWPLKSERRTHCEEPVRRVLRIDKLDGLGLERPAGAVLEREDEARRLRVREDEEVVAVLDRRICEEDVRRRRKEVRRGEEADAQ